MSDPIYVDLFDGTRLEFEPGTSQAVIDKAAKAETTRLKVERRKATLARNPAEYDPSSPEYRAKYGATSGNNFFQNANIGIGKMFTDLGLGAKQIAGMAPPEAAAEKRALDADIMGTAGGKVGYVAGGMAAGAPIAMAAGATVPGAMLAGGVLGALQPAGGMGERYLNTGRDALAAGLMQQGINGALRYVGGYKLPTSASVPGAQGGVTPGSRVAVPETFVNPSPAVRESYQPTGTDALARAGATAEARAGATGSSGAGTSVSINPTVNLRQQGGYTFGEAGPDPSMGLTRSQQRLAEWGGEQELRLTPGQASGSKVLQRLEAKLESQPMTAGPFDAIKANNARKINAIISKSIGEKADEVSADVLDAADKRLGDVFDLARDPNTILMADSASTKALLDQMDGELLGLIPEGAFRGHPLVKIFETQMDTGTVNGEQLGQLSSKLSRAAYKEMSGPSGDRDLGMALASLKEHVDDLLEGSMGPEFRAQYAEARRQYRNLINITHARGTVNTGTGNVSGRLLAGTLKTKDKKGYTFGRNNSDLYNAARFSEAFAPIVGDSGTATRSALPSSSLEFALGIPINLVTRAYTSNTASATAGAAARAASKAGPYASRVAQPVGRAANYGGQALPYMMPGYLNALYGLDR